MPARKRPVPMPDPLLAPVLTACALCGDDGRWFPHLGIVVHRPLRKCVVQHVEVAAAQSERAA